MKEAHNIIISGIIFHVEPEGHHLLQSYLKSLREKLKQHYSEFEGEVAEFLLQKLNNGYIHTTLRDVEHLIKSLSPVLWQQIGEEVTERGKGLRMNACCS